MMPFKDVKDAASIIEELRDIRPEEFPIFKFDDEDREEDAVRIVTLLPRVPKNKARQYLNGRTLSDFLTGDKEYFESRGMKKSHAKHLEDWLAWKAPES